MQSLASDKDSIEYERKSQRKNISDIKKAGVNPAFFYFAYCNNP
jgi:hypothetical protein